MSYRLRIAQQVISGYAEECVFKDEEGHNAEGTGPDCNAHCRWLDSDRRILEDREDQIVEMDDDGREEYADPVQWAAYYLQKNFPQVEPPSSTYHDPAMSLRDQWNQAEAPPQEWLYGCEHDPYLGDWERTEETSIYLEGDWTEEERGRVFLLSRLDWKRMDFLIKEVYGESE